jgi:hypothetical protein|tara:strand:- start:1032 stop:1556 length:525 start_codon:yes stop_codon:yes gene_type:complete
MACLLTKGRELPCKSGVGGLKSVTFADYGTLGALTIANSLITDFGGTPTFMKFDIKGNSTLDTTVNSSRENGTTFYESTLTLNLTFQEEKTQDEIKLLAVSRPHIIVEDYNGNFRLVGKDHGCELTTGTFSSGAAMGDLYGYSLTFVAQETEAPDYIATAAYNAETQGSQIDVN